MPIASKLLTINTVIHMFQKIRYALQRFMQGRYGTDKLNTALLILGMILCLVGSFADKMLIYDLAYIPLIYGLFRMFSRKIEARRAENAAFERLLRRLKDRSHRYFRCPNCKQTVRVPKGKGKISIRCPKCGESFIKKT